MKTVCWNGDKSEHSITPQKSLKEKGKTPKKRTILPINIYLTAQEEFVSAETQSAAAAAPGGKNSPCTFLFSFFYYYFLENSPGCKVFALSPIPAFWCSIK